MNEQTTTLTYDIFPTMYLLLFNGSHSPLNFVPSRDIDALRCRHCFTTMVCLLSNWENYASSLLLDHTNFKHHSFHIPQQKTWQLFLSELWTLDGHLNECYLSLHLARTALDSKTYKYPSSETQIKEKTCLTWEARRLLPNTSPQILHTFIQYFQNVHCIFITIPCKHKSKEKEQTWAMQASQVHRPWSPQICLFRTDNKACLI